MGLLLEWSVLLFAVRLRVLLRVSKNILHDQEARQKPQVSALHSSASSGGFFEKCAF